MTIFQNLLFFKEKKTVILFLAFFSLLATVHAQDKEDSDGKMHIKINGKDIEEDDNDSTDQPDIKIFFNEAWRYTAGDSSIYAALDFDDSGWKKIGKGRGVDISEDSSLSAIKEIIWFRTVADVDTSAINKAIGIYIRQNGSAAELFIDGTLVEHFGKVGHDIKSEEARFSISPKPVPFVFSKPGKHLVALRFSAYHYHKMKIADKSLEFSIVFTDFKENLNSVINNEANFPTIFLFAVYLTLGIVHTIMFVFFRTDRHNLFFGLYCISISFLLFFGYFALTDSDFEIFNFLTRILVFVGPLILVPLVALYHTIYYNRLLKVFWILVGLYVLIVLSVIFSWDKEPVFLSFLIIISIVEIFRAHIRSIIKGRDGALILGMGVLYLPFSIIILAIFIGIMESQDVKFDYGKVIARSLVYSLALSTPLSITIYLSRSFARINRKLILQVDEIRELSDRTLKQEVEKKQILEEQNLLLETKVLERTRELADKNELILIKNKEITDNLNYAKRIQAALLPDLEDIQRVFRECFIYYQPKDIVSGDFYSFFIKDDKVLLAAVDCTGHGVSGAFMSMIGSSALSQIINIGQIVKPSQVLDRLNEEIINSLNQKSGSSNDGMDIALCCFDFGQMKLEFAGANRPLWLIRDKQLVVYSPDKIPIGGVQFESRTLFTNHVVELRPDDCIYLFSDGFADQFGGERGKKLMTRKLKDIFLSINHLSMAAQNEYLIAFMSDWKGNNEQLDDNLVIGIRI